MSEYQKHVLTVLGIFLFIIIFGLLLMRGMALLPSAEVPRPFTMSEPVRITSTGSFEENWAALCPTGNETLITRSVQEPGTDFLYRIGLLHSDGTFEQLTPRGDFQDVKPDWSPDCEWVTFERLEGELTNVYIMKADKSELRQAMDVLAAHLHSYAPSWSKDPNMLVVTISDCTVCVPEDERAYSHFGIVRLDQAGKTYFMVPPSNLGWGYMSNASFSDTGNEIIFNVRINDLYQIGMVSNILTNNPTWTQITDEPWSHVRPVFLPTRNDALIYMGTADRRLDAFLLYKGQSYNLTQEFGPCKDPDVKKEGEAFKIIATCDNGKGVSDFLEFNLTLQQEKQN